MSQPGLQMSRERRLWYVREIFLPWLRTKDQCRASRALTLRQARELIKEAAPVTREEVGATKREWARWFQ